MSVNRDDIEKEVKELFFFKNQFGGYSLNGGIYYYDIVDYVVKKLKEQS